jgi:hypothetical protein
MLVIDKNIIDYFKKVTKFAADTNQSEDLWQQLLYLHYFRDPEIPVARNYNCERCDFVFTSVPDLERAPHCPSCGRGVGLPAKETIEGLRGLTACQSRCRLSVDSVPASFGFVLETWNELTGWSFMFNGGLIYHGKQAGWTTPKGYVIKDGEGVPTFSVRLGDDPNPWSIHT